MICFLTNRGFSLIKLAVSSVIAAGATIGTAIFYAGRDERIRDDFENKVPLAKTVLTSVYGEKSKPEEHSDNQDTLFPKSKEEKKEEKTFSPESSELVCTFLINHYLLIIYCCISSRFVQKHTYKLKSLGSKFQCFKVNPFMKKSHKSNGSK